MNGRAMWITDTAVARLSAVPKEQRLFLWAHYYDPHYEFESRPELDWSDGYDGWIASLQ